MEEATEVDGSVSIRIGFGFNNPKFSDRILRIELTHDPSESKAEGSERCGVTAVHISSLVLASQSPFFCKMFSNGMKDSEQQAVALSVHASEELALLDLLQFMYSNTLKANTSYDLLKVLILADRFQVVTCVAHCAQRLSELLMTFELAALCINLPSRFLEGGNSPSKSLIDKATCFLSQNFGSHYQAALNLPLESIEKLLSWDTLEVDCEDEVFDFLLKWARIHYKDLSERCRVFSLQLCPLIRLPYMSSEKLKNMLQCRELEQCDATEMVVEALLLRFENRSRHGVATRRGQGRTYKLKPLQVIVLEDSPYPESIVHLMLKKDEFITLTRSSAKISTQKFHVGNELFCLEFERLPVQKSPSGVFAITLSWCSYRSMTDVIKVDCEIAMRLKTSSIFTEVDRGSGDLINCWYFEIGESWDLVMADDSEYFIDGVLYVRVTILLQQ